jgi:hypothetical protein
MIRLILDLTLRLLAVRDVYKDCSEAYHAVAVQNWAAGGAQPLRLTGLGDNPTLAGLHSSGNHRPQILDGREVVRVDKIRDRAPDNFCRTVSGDLLHSRTDVSHPSIFVQRADDFAYILD